MRRVELVKNGRQVLIVDFDLEAPDSTRSTSLDSTRQKRVVDFVLEYLEPLNTGRSQS